MPSIEDRIEALTSAVEKQTAAINANTEALKAVEAGRAAAIEAAKAASAGASAPRTRPKKSDPDSSSVDSAAEVVTPAAETPAPTEQPTEAAADVPTLEQAQEAVSAYVGAAEWEAEREARIAKVQELYGKIVPQGQELRAANVPADKRQPLINTMTKLLAMDPLTPKPASAAATASADDLL